MKINPGKCGMQKTGMVHELQEGISSNTRLGSSSPGVAAKANEIFEVDYVADSP